MNFTFGEYEEWMRDQVIGMFCEQYGNSREQFSDYFTEFYSGFQKNRAIRLVILSEKKVAGFVSFSYWPYLVQGNACNSYQCGNVIINKDFRGQGLYNKLLDHLNSNAGSYGIDFLVGFPIKEIVKLYLKSGWKNPFNLNWYVKALNPFGILFSVTNEKLAGVFSTTKKYTRTYSRESEIILGVDNEFYAWNEAYNNMTRHFYLNFDKKEDWIEFSVKLNKRKYFNELILGEINTNSDDPVFIKEALARLKKTASSVTGISFLSVCLNPNGQRKAITKAIEELRFRKINREVKFITKNFRLNETVINDPANWTLYRRDVDTW